MERRACRWENPGNVCRKASSFESSLKATFEKKANRENCVYSLLEVVVTDCDSSFSILLVTPGSSEEVVAVSRVSSSSTSSEPRSRISLSMMSISVVISTVSSSLRVVVGSLNSTFSSTVEACTIWTRACSVVAVVASLEVSK